VGTDDSLLDIKAPRLVIGGVTSGEGKTTFVAGLIGALRQRGLRVAPFKVGPDYIDPGYHSRMAGLPCRNLDSWMISRDALVELFARSTESCDIAVVEGVMGLFDGRSGLDEDGSTAQVAKLLGAPVVLLMSVAKTSRSAGAVALGFKQFDPDLRLGGVVLNRVGSPAHGRWVREAVEHSAKISVLGHLPRRSDLVLPERHLGLVPTAESAPDDRFFQQLVEQIEATVDVDGLLSLSRSAEPLAVRPTGLFPTSICTPEVRIGIALDRAFNFYYEDNLDLLRAWGADLIPFSPLDDDDIPEGLHGLYIGGGFPELFAAELSANRSMIESLRSAIERGLPTYAECGGLMYLSQGIEDFDGRYHPLVGAVPTSSAMAGRKLTMGYRTAIAQNDNLFLKAGESVRGHEFHWSVTTSTIPAERVAYRFAESPDHLEGYVSGNLLASYLHLHFAAHPGLARNFIQVCKKGKQACLHHP
jgi:cobyrinic acid a,c-diamide synthase